MKKTLVIFTAILVSLFLVLSVLDKSEYVLEKRLWRAQKQVEDIARDPQVVPDQKFKDIIREYREAIGQFPDSKLAPGIYFQIGRLYGLKKDFTAARAVMGEILKQYEDNPVLCAEALFFVGQTYEAEKNEEEAIKTYKHILEAYPLTRGGLNVPLYIADYYLRMSKPDKSRKALDEAAAFYKRISREHPQSLVEFGALDLLVRTYLFQGNWVAAVDTSEKILLDYFSKEQVNPVIVQQILKSINTASVIQLKDYDRPARIYKKFIEQNPGHRLNNVLQGMVDALEELKRSGAGAGKKEDDK